MDWEKKLTKEQKFNLCVLQTFFSKLNLTNLETAEIMTYCKSKEGSYILFDFMTSRFLNDKEVAKKVLMKERDIFGESQ